MPNARCFYNFPNKHWFPFQEFPKLYISLLPGLVFIKHLIKFFLFFLSPSSPFGFLGIDVGVYNAFGLVPQFPNGEALSIHPFVLILHSSDCDLNVKTLEGKCIQR